MMMRWREDETTRKDNNKRYRNTLIKNHQVKKLLEDHGIGIVSKLSCRNRVNVNITGNVSNTKSIENV
jgi:hypothetical protein